MLLSSKQDMKEGLLKFQGSVNLINRQGDALLHSLVKTQFKKKRLKRDLLTALMTYSDADVNLKNDDMNTALHLAVQVIHLAVCVGGWVGVAGGAA